ncbi:hypothetical protein [Bradyrhizobium zhanjiangense]|uniref:hypothetical protein n=1 Tax=Bradyrhizobium zhanjiangense TaxID=1325107 RepID=UPI001008CA52|nr:hypothetical protein [Bradyrhizobium zhanjiangense]
MGQKSEPAAFEQVYVVGLDDDGRPLGARFTMLRDSIVSAAMDIKNCRVLIRQPAEVCAVARKLPIGHVFGSGKMVTLLLSNIRRELYVAILAAERLAAQQDNLRVAGALLRTIH